MGHEPDYPSVGAVSKLARVADDRDAVNEAFVFVSLVDKVIPHSFWSIDGRSNAIWNERDGREETRREGAALPGR